MQFVRNLVKWWNKPNKNFIEQVLEFCCFIVFIFLIRTWFYGLYQVPSGSMETTMLVGEGYVSDKFTYTFLREPRRGEIIAFNEPSYPYSHNPVKYFWEKYVWGPSNWTKRVIGLPGDHVEGRVEDGHPVVYINGEKFNEPYLNKYPLIPVDYSLSSWRSYDSEYSHYNQPFYRMDKDVVTMVQRTLRQQGYEASREPNTPMPGRPTCDIYDVHLKCKDKDGVDEYWVMGDNRLGSGDSRAFGPLKRDLIHGRIIFRLFSVDAQHSWLVIDLLTHPIDFFKRIRWSRFLQCLK
jgi:signal peptidase I